MSFALGDFALLDEFELLDGVLLELAEDETSNMSWSFIGEGDRSKRAAGKGVLAGDTWPARTLALPFPRKS